MGADASDLSRWDVHWRLSDVASYLSQQVPDSLAARDTTRLLQLFHSEKLRAVWAAVEDEIRNDGYNNQIQDAADAYESAAIDRIEAVWKSAE